MSLAHCEVKKAESLSDRHPVFKSVCVPSIQTDVFFSSPLCSMEFGDIAGRYIYLCLGADRYDKPRIVDDIQGQATDNLR